MPLHRRIHAVMCAGAMDSRRRHVRIRALLRTAVITGLMSAAPLLMPHSSIAATLTLDLARQAPGTIRTEPVRPNENVEILVVHALSSVRYEYRVGLSRTAMPPLDEKQFVSTAQLPSLAPNGPDPCTTVSDALWSGLATSKDEIAVRNATSRARHDASTACAKDGQEALAKLIDDLTSIPIGNHRLSLGDELVVSVSRAAGDAILTWQLKVTTESAGEWRLMYGFNWVPNEDERFFLRPRDDGKFDVVAERGDDDLTSIPSIFATWTSTSQQRRGMGFGFVAGLGFDASNPIGFAGVTAVWHENVSINVGAVIHKQRRLNARLSTSTPVAENLGDEELHDEQYRGNIFVGLGFRFGNNPFKKKAEDEAAEEKDRDKGK